MIDRLRQSLPDGATRHLSLPTAFMRMRWVLLAMIFLSNASQTPSL
jgi:hypothetical protein